MFFLTFSYASPILPLYMHHTVIVIKITVAPTNDIVPGISPSIRNTQSGFNSGSITPIRQQASGGQLLSARPTRIYGIPSWTTPRTASQKNAL